MKWPKPHFQEFPHCNPHWKQPWCGVTGWTNFSAIFLFLLSFLHDLATIGTVAGVSDNFLIFWAALLSQTSKKKVSCEDGGFMLWIWYYAQIDRVLCHILLIKINPIWTSLFWFFKDSGGGADLPPPSKNGGNGWEVPKIEFEPHILPRLMPDKRIYDFQIPRTTLTNGLKKWFFQWVYEVRKGPPLWKLGILDQLLFFLGKRWIFLGSNMLHPLPH